MYELSFLAFDDNFGCNWVTFLDLTPGIVLMGIEIGDYNHWGVTLLNSSYASQSNRLWSIHVADLLYAFDELCLVFIVIGCFLAGLMNLHLENL